MWKFLFFAGACFLLYKLMINDRKKKEQVKQAKEAELAKEGVLVKDPVCGVYVSRDSGIRVKDGEEVRCFCSYECREKYLKMME